MHRDAERSQAAGNAHPRHSKGQRALIGAALAVLAIAAAVLGNAVLSREEGDGGDRSDRGERDERDRKDEATAFEARVSRASSAGNQVELIETMSVELAALRRELETERMARQALAKQLASLSARIGKPGSETRDADPTSPDRQTDDAATKLAASAAQMASQAKPRPSAKQQDRPWFDRNALERAGISSSEIEEIVERWEQHEMAKLYLDDQSRREGTFRTPGYNQQLAGLDRELRGDLGTEGYDAYLYATSQNNRVVVRQVLENSPSGRAGLRAGDQIISYSGERVFWPRELKFATAAGEPGTPVVLEVLRDGRLIRFNVPNGPQGLSLQAINALPLPDW